MACITENLLCNNAPSHMSFSKYKPWKEYVSGLPSTHLWTPETRKWPDTKILRAPRWCSVDLRDGNQALPNPMNTVQKLTLFRTLVEMGFKEIEIGFPSASQIEADFCRKLIDGGLIPDDVWVSVLVQAREELICETFKAIKDAKNVIIHMYNSTSELQRRVVFRKTQDEIKMMAVQGVRWIAHYRDAILGKNSTTRTRLEYSPESFSVTEVSFALEVCQAVLKEWRLTDSSPVIFNLPETVQASGPHFYADQVEWMHRHFSLEENIRSDVILSVHPHNDRGTGIASAELALHAGADRVEGCLFGNGERTGNVCTITLAMNLFHLGIDPELNLSRLPELIRVYESCTGLRVPERHPWAGQLVYTAFSGSHQDAIRKGLSYMQAKQKADLNPVKDSPRNGELIPKNAAWEIPYLPIDPEDIGRAYEPIIRINAQSGKGGVAFVMESSFGITLPRAVQSLLSSAVQAYCDKTAQEIEIPTVYSIFEQSFLRPGMEGPLRLQAYRIFSRGADKRLIASGGPFEDDLSMLQLDEQLLSSDDDAIPKGSPLRKWVLVERPVAGTVPTETESATITPGESTTSSAQPSPRRNADTNEVTVVVEAKLSLKGEKVRVVGEANGPLAAFLRGLNSFYSSTKGLGPFEISSYSENAVVPGTSAEAICFIELQLENQDVKAQENEKGFWGIAKDSNTTTAALRAICCAFNRNNLFF